MFIYYIVPMDGTENDAFARANFYVPTIKAAKRYAQTLTTPAVSGKAGLEIVLKDQHDKEIWRGPYLGNE